MTTLAYKTIGDDDEPLLFRMFSDVRSAELGMQEWNAAVRDPILRLQYTAQRRGYLERHPNADFRLILRDESPIGWLIVERTATALHGIDIALIANERSRGTGTRIIRALQDEAAAAGQPMIIAVLRTNVRAIALYRRLGFGETASTETHVWMEWRRE